jgi:hypothetical protein
MGPLAFMPGEMKHTNEILVLLGEDYFALRSASQVEHKNIRLEFFFPSVSFSRA